MGYTTYFEGSFELDRPLTVAHKTYLEKFAGTRHMKRDAALAARRDDPVREAVGLPVGDEGAYFVGDRDDWNAEHGPDVVDPNREPEAQPSMYCQWVPNEEGTSIAWDGGEKFYGYVEWIAYLIEHFLEPWGYKVNGTVEWDGEERDDIGRIRVEDNMVSAKQGRVVYD